MFSFRKDDSKYCAEDGQANFEPIYVPCLPCQHMCATSPLHASRTSWVCSDSQDRLADLIHLTQDRSANPIHTPLVSSHNSCSKTFDKPFPSLESILTEFSFSFLSSTVSNTLPQSIAHACSVFEISFELFALSSQQE